jgi:hypothetical protein
MGSFSALIRRHHDTRVIFPPLVTDALRILRDWRKELGRFVRAEWQSAALGFSSGAAVAACGTLIATYARCHPKLTQLADLKPYNELFHGEIRFLWLVFTPLILIVFVKLTTLCVRASKSWILGVTGGSYFWPFVIAASLFWNRPVISGWRVSAAVATVCFALLVGFALRLRATAASEQKLDDVAIKPRASAGTSHPGRDSESPIESWDEDLLNRSSFVEMLAMKILVSKIPVIALRGAFGDGKSSVLNLLRLQLGDRAIVISFSSWLPDSHQSLVNDLLGDLAAETGRHFVIPGLRKRLRKFASLLGGTVPQLKALPELLPPYTQRQEVSDLGEILARVPKRIVVLLDEIDRMQKEELLVLLKVLRGASSFQNITFVCALHQEEVEKVACGTYDERSHEYFEKFFPTAIDLAHPNPDVLKHVLRNHLATDLERLKWFSSPQEQATFVERFDQFWQDALCLVCTNIRKIRLLANDIHATAALVVREVDPIDLCALGAVRRFHPKVYDLIWKNASFFSQSDNWWKSTRGFQSEADRAGQTARIASAMTFVAGEAGPEISIYPLLRTMFPARVKELTQERSRSTVSDDFEESERGKRISHPDYFPIYFRYDVPELIFSSAAMDAFRKELIEARGDDERISIIFERRFKSFEADSLRRFDFVLKLSLDLGEKLPIEVAKSVAFAIARNAEVLGDEFVVSETNRALTGVLAVAQRLSTTGEINTFIAGAIRSASTDLFAARLFRLMSRDQSTNKVVRNFGNVDEAFIQDAFTDRMSSRYGPNVDLADFDISWLNPYAMFTWADISPKEQAQEIQFWESYIGNCRQRLAAAFEVIAPKGTVWRRDSAQFVERLIPAATLSRLRAECTADGALDPTYVGALDRLDRYLRNELHDGEILGQRSPHSEAAGG